MLDRAMEGDAEDQVDSHFNTFRSGEAQLLNGILARRGVPNS
jgi:hypothetical protein